MFGPLYNTFRERPVRYRMEPGMSHACTDFQMRGITSGTRIATAEGWRPVEYLTVGTHVLTFDNGPQEIVAITRSAQFVHGDVAPDFASPIDVPAGVIGNSEPMVLLPEQNVMIESDEAEAISGDPFALVPAKALVGFQGVERFRALRPFEVITLHFANDEVIYAEGGALVLAQADVPGTVASLDDLGQPGLATPYVAYTGREAAALVAALGTQDTHAPTPAPKYAAAA